MKKVFNLSMFKISNLDLDLSKKPWIATELKLFLSNVRMYEWGVPDDLGEPSEDLDESELEIPVHKSETTEHVMNLDKKYKNGQYERLYKGDSTHTGVIKLLWWETCGFLFYKKTNQKRINTFNPGGTPPKKIYPRCSNTGNTLFVHETDIA